MSSLDLSLITGHETIGADPLTSTGVQLQAGGTVNTKGVWAELAASTGGEASWIHLEIGAQNAAGRFLIDIGIGALGAEVAFLGNLAFDSSNASGGVSKYSFPVAIPAGSRISARTQCSVSGGQLRIGAHLDYGDPGSATAPATVVAYGATTADSGLTQVDPGAVADTDSSWVELAAATTADARWLALSIGHDAVAISASCRWRIDVATGASGSEVVLLAGLFVIASTLDDMPYPRVFGFPVNLATGTRLAVRARCSSTSTPTRLLDIAVHLADAATPAGGASAHASAAWSG